MSLKNLNIFLYKPWTKEELKIKIINYLEAIKKWNTSYPTNGVHSTGFRKIYGLTYGHHLEKKGKKVTVHYRNCKIMIKKAK